MPSNRTYILGLLEAYEPRLREAFRQAIYELRDGVNLKQLAERLERRDLAGAIEALNLDDAALRAFDRAFGDAYEAGGRGAVNAMPALSDPQGGAFVIRFDVRNPLAELWLRNHSSTLIREIIEDQRAAARAAMADGLAAGKGGRSIALDIAGRINATTGRREGGIIGLTQTQEEWVAAYSRELADPNLLSRALQRNLRDKRYDRTIAKAIREGTEIPAAMRAKMVSAYATRALRFRAEAIARTEAMTAMHASASEAYRQAIADGRVDVNAVTKTWHSAGDNRVRHTHRSMNGQKIGFEASFVSPSGAQLRYPCDPKAPAAERVNCRCWCEIKIDFLYAVT